MDCIAVVDDRAEQRGTVVKYIARGLKKLSVDWRVIDAPPFPAIADYAAWIRENDVRVLVLDEKLAEEITDDIPIDYSGHDVAAHLRRLIPDLPQVIITAVPDSDDLDGAEKLDAVLGRTEFLEHSATHVERMVRMGMSFVERHEGELAEMTLLSEKAITGGLSDDERNRLSALRQKTQSTAHAVGSEELHNWLEDAQRLQGVLEDLLGQLQGAKQ